MPSTIGAMAGVVVGAMLGMASRKWRVVLAVAFAAIGGIVLYYVLGAVGVP